MIKNKFKNAFLFLLFFLIPVFLFAQEEIEIIGITPFQVIVGAAGLIAVLMLIVNAIQFLTSGSIAKKAHNKEKIALLGVFLTALASWAILFTTNPDIIQKISFEVDKITSEESLDPLSFFFPTKKPSGQSSGGNGGGGGGGGGQTFQCSDGRDNDGDTLVDLNDTGCLSAQDNDESNQSQNQGGGNPECSDGIDNDNNSWIDMGDPGCGRPQDENEYNPPTQYQCSDAVDNDSDGKVDGRDPDCSNWNDDNESADQRDLKQCEDGVDNDGDNLKDFPADPGCTSAQDDSETNQTVFACSDGRDNDGDGWRDTIDPGCSNGNDNDESNSAGNTQCSNLVDDNDPEDSLIDGNDSGCVNPSDNNETNSVVYECSDGDDNDGDGLTDFPADPGCTSAQDDDEFNEDLSCPYGNEDLNQYANCTFNIDLQNRWYDESNMCDDSKPRLSELGVINTAYTINSSAWGIEIDSYCNGTCDGNNWNFSLMRDFVDMTDDDIDQSFNSWLNGMGKELKPIPNSMNGLIVIDIEGFAHSSARIGWGKLYCDDIDYADPDCDENDPYPYSDSAGNGILNEDGVDFETEMIPALKRRISKARQYFPNAKLVYYGVVQPSTNGSDSNPNFKERMLGYELAGDRGLYNGLDYLSPWLPIRSSEEGGWMYENHDESAEQAIEATRQFGLPVIPMTSFEILGAGSNDPPDRDEVSLYAIDAALDQHRVFQDESVAMILYWMGSDNGCNAHSTVMIPDYFDRLRVVPSSCFCPL